MQIENVRNTENFWINIVEGSVNAGNSVTYVPLDGLERQTAAKLATSLHIMVFIKGNHYVFTKGLQEILQDDQNLH